MNKKYINQLYEFMLSHHAQGTLELDEERLDELLADIKDVMISQFKGRKPSISPSGLSGAPRKLRAIEDKLEGDSKEQFVPRTRIKLIISSVTEHLVVYLMELAGIPIERRQERTKIDLGEIQMGGRWDYVLDGEIVDFKCTNDEAYKTTFKNADVLVQGNDFKAWYAAQGEAYSLGGEIPFGGWHVFNLNTCDIKCVPMTEYARYKAKELMYEFRNNLTTARHADSMLDIASCHNPYTNRAGEKVLAWECARCPYVGTCWPEFVKDKQNIAKVRYVKKERE